MGVRAGFQRTEEIINTAYEIPRKAGADLSGEAGALSTQTMSSLDVSLLRGSMRGKDNIC